MEKKNNPFAIRVTYKGQTNFDKDYIDRHIKTVLKKTGPGEFDYKTVDKVVDIRKDIHDFVNADANNVGVYNLLNQLARQDGEVAKNDIIKQAVTGNVFYSDDIADLTDAPSNLMEAVDQVRNIEKTFNSLPKEITKGQDLQTFFKNYDPKQLDEYYSNIAKGYINAEKAKKIKIDENKEIKK